MTFTDEQTARAAVIVALGLALLVNVPLLVANTVVGGDDWAWIWTFHHYGAGAVQRFVTDSGHPGFGLVLNLLLSIGGDDVGRLAHFYAVGFHLGCGWLLWRIFRDARFSPSLAATVAVLYLASPFLAGIRGSWAHALYDSSIFFYLFSVWISLRAGYLATLAACITALFGLSIETLMALEPLRWWVLYRRRGELAGTARAALPYFALALLVSVARVFWFVPSGPYAGYNSVVHAGLDRYLLTAIKQIWFFIDISQPVIFAGSLLRYDNPLIFWMILIAACAASASLCRARLIDNRDLLGLFVVGGAVLLLGMAPYVMIDEVPSRVDVASRFAVASQFGAFMFMAGSIQLLRFAPVRAGALAVLVFVFMANQLQLGKWLLYEGQVVGDFRQLTAAYLAHSGSQVLTINFEPASHDFLYLNRACLGAYDTNASFDLANERGGSFIFDGGCPYRYFSKTTSCSVIGFDPPVPCPTEQRKAIFRLKPDLGPFTHFHVFDLVKYTLSGHLWNAGDLISPVSALPEPPSDPANLPAR